MCRPTYSRSVHSIATLPVDRANNMLNASRNLVAIVTPQHKFPLSAEERISLSHLRKHLGSFDRYIVCPRSQRPNLPDFEKVCFHNNYFRDAWGYNRLLLSKNFYRQFREYEYILIYQFDCLVFGNELASWCSKGWDYVGAPWLQGFEDDIADGFWAVGNGGFSLRKVQSHIDVLNSRVLVRDPGALCKETAPLQRIPILGRCTRGLLGMLYKRGCGNSIGAWLKQFSSSKDMHEDIFWSFYAKRFDRQYTVPTPMEALPFAFECAPEYCFEQNKATLPFGCHAWAKWGRDFWLSHLERTRK